MLWGKIYNSPALIGPIEYKSKEEIIAHLQDSEHLDDVKEELLGSLFTKRTEFEHEKEARIIIGVDNEVLRDYQRYIDVPFDPLALFNSFMIDPRESRKNETIIRAILTQMGVPEERISKSQLYTFEKTVVQLCKY